MEGIAIAEDRAETMSEWFGESSVLLKDNLLIILF